MNYGKPTRYSPPAPATGALARLLGEADAAASARGDSREAPSRHALRRNGASGHSAIIIADDITAAGYLYNEHLCRSHAIDAAGIFPSGYSVISKYDSLIPLRPDYCAHGGARDRLKGKNPPRWVVTCPRKPLLEKKSGLCPEPHIGKTRIRRGRGELSPENIVGPVKRLFRMVGFNTQNNSLRTRTVRGRRGV